MSETVIKVSGLSVFYGKNEALSNIDLEIKKGDYLGIIGPNGSGKSTLIKAMLGLIKHTGKVAYEGSPRIGYVPQFAAIDRGFPITVSEVVLSGTLEGFRPFYKYGKNQRAAAKKAMETLAISHLEKRQAEELSGGEFQRMLLARALASEPDILFLDEPTASVDSPSAKIIYGILSEISKKITVILVTHDLFAISSEVRSVACLNHELVYHGLPELTDTVTEKLYGCPVDLIAHGVPHRVLECHDHEHCGHDHGSAKKQEDGGRADV